MLFLRAGQRDWDRDLFVSVGWEEREETGVHRPMVDLMQRIQTKLIKEQVQVGESRS